MCAHYTLFLDNELEDIREIVWIVEKKTGQKQAADIWPGTTAPVLLPAAGRGLRVQPMVWGFPWRRIKKDGTPGATRYLQNTRQDTAGQKPFWRESYETRRCLVPAAGFYEQRKNPDGTHTPILFYTPGAMLYIAGIWQKTQDTTYFSMLTTHPNKEVAGVHDRMPLVLNKDELGEWLYGSYESLASRAHIALAHREAKE